MSGLFTGHIFQGMGDGEETTAPAPAESAPSSSKVTTGSEKGGTISPMDQMPMSQTMPGASSTPWVPIALIGGGVAVAGVLIWMATSGGKVTANRRRRRRGRRA